MDIKNKIPEGWEIFNFGNKELINIIDGDRGKNYPKEKDFFDKEYCLFLNTKNVTSKGFNFDTNKFITKEKDSLLRNGKLNRYDIVMTTRGTIGNCGFYDDFVKYDNIRINSGMVIFRVISDKIFQKYLYMFLTSDIMKNQILNYTTGTAQPQLPIWSINKLYFLLPPLAEQKRIASILSSLDDKIELNNKTNRILEELAQTIFEEWFINFNFPNEYGKPYKKSGGEMIGSELGKIPKGWKVGILGDIISIESGKRPNVSSKNITKEYNIPIYGASSQIGYTNSILFNEKILITGRVGTHGIVQRINFPCWASDNTFVIRSKFHEYAYQYLKRIDYINLNRGTTQPLIVQSDIKKVKVLLNDKIINRYENLTSSLWALWHKNVFENEKLSGIRDSLLPKLMSGEIRL